METKKRFILIPWDNTKIAENALLHGIKIAKMVDTSVMLLNIVKKNISLSEKAKIQSDLNDLTERYINEYKLD